VRGRIPGAVVAGGLAAAAATALALPAPAPPRAAPDRLAVPAPVVPAFTPGPARPLPAGPRRARWAPVRQATVARTGPSRAARAVAALARRTPEKTDNVVLVLRRRDDRAGRPWVFVRLAVLPNGTTGWVPRSALGGYVTVSTRLDVDLRRLRAVLYRDGRAVFRAPVAVGRPGWATPRGDFYIRNRLTRYRSPAYGPVAFGTSARSPTATGWPAGGFVGIHGTDRPDLVPGRVSHGCIRLRNADIRELARRMSVGTPVRIR
jgi:lipoprotein-anchoring transpeptidase ErfK/SrfK